MRVLVDTNIILAIVPRKSEHRWLYELIRQEKIAIILSNEIVDEYEEKLTWFYSDYFAELVLEELLNIPSTELHDIHFKWGLIQQDYDDNEFVDTAISSNADCIITNDKHFNIISEVPFPKVICYTLADFKAKFYKD